MEYQRIINVKKTTPSAIIPTRGSAYAAGYDLYAVIDGQIEIQPHQTVKIGTGICMEIPDGYCGLVYPRSGFATKYGLRPANCVGVIDSDYRGEIIVALHNDSTSPQTVINGDRIAQLVVTEFLTMNFQEVDELNETERGTCGFGSTGKGIGAQNA